MTVVRNGLIVVGAIIGMAGCSKGGSAYGNLACLDDWPAAPSAGLRASLPVQPSIIWQATLGQVPWPAQPGVSLSADRIIVSGGAAWVGLDRKTGTQLVTGSTAPDPPNYFLGAPAVDEQGNIYAQSHVALYAFSVDGKLRWSWAIPGQAQSSEPVSGDFNPSVVGDGRVLAPSLAQLLALNAVPERLWTSPLGVRFSAGHWGVGYDGTAAYMLNLRTGKTAGRLRAPDGHDVIPLVPLAGRGVLTMDRDNATALRLVMLDTCGAALWSLSIPGSKVCTGLSVVGPGEIIYMGIGSCDGGEPSPSILGIGPGGTIVNGPTKALSAPWVVGADGIVYSVELSRRLPPSKLIAWSPALEMLWTLDLPGVLDSFASAVLTDDGVLYAQMSTDDGNAVVAVQTPSPGLAPSSWPTRRHDNRSSNWIAGSP